MVCDTVEELKKKNRGGGAKEGLDILYFRINQEEVFEYDSEVRSFLLFLSHNSKAFGQCRVYMNKL